MICEVCMQNLQDDFSFCPYCGEPQNELAKSLVSKKQKTAQLKILSSLLDSTEDLKTAALIKNIITNMK